MYVRVTSMGRVSKAGRVCLRHTNLNSMLSRNFRVSAKSSQCLEQLVTCVVQILLWNPKIDIIIPFIQILTESIFIYSSLFLQSIILFVEISFEKKNVYHLQLIYGIKYEIKKIIIFGNFWWFKDTAYSSSWRDCLALMYLGIFLGRLDGLDRGGSIHSWLPPTCVNNCTHHSEQNLSVHGESNSINPKTNVLI